MMGAQVAHAEELEPKCLRIMRGSPLGEGPPWLSGREARRAIIFAPLGVIGFVRPFIPRTAQLSSRPFGVDRVSGPPRSLPPSYVLAFRR